MHCCPQWRHFGQSSSADRKNGQGSLKHDIKVKLNSCSTSAIKLSNSLRWVITSIIPKSEDQPPFLNAFFAFYPVIDQRQHSNIQSKGGGLSNKSSAPHTRSSSSSNHRRLQDSNCFGHEGETNSGSDSPALSPTKVMRTGGQKTTK